MQPDLTYPMRMGLFDTVRSEILGAGGGSPNQGLLKFLNANKAELTNPTIRLAEPAIEKPPP
jgi:hypothetical protein